MRAEYGHGFLSAPDDEDRCMFQWLHIRSGESCTVVFGDKAPLWYKAHWYGGRMQPCIGEECRMCAAGVGRQRRWVFAVKLVGGKKPMLWEVSESLAQDIKAIANEKGELERLKLYVIREGSGNKGRMSVTGRGYDEAHMIRIDGVDTVIGGEEMIFPEPQEALELTWAGIERQSESFAESRSATAESRSERYQERREY